MLGFARGWHHRVIARVRHSRRLVWNMPQELDATSLITKPTQHTQIPVIHRSPYDTTHSCKKDSDDQ